MEDINLYEILLYPLEDILLDEELSGKVLVGLTAFYYSVICCDNEISDLEKKDLQKYINNIIFNENIPDETKSMIFPVANFDMTFDRLIPILEKVEYHFLAFFNSIFEYIVNIDNVYCISEQNFQKRWAEYLIKRKTNDDNYDKNLENYLVTITNFSLALYDSCISIQSRNNMHIPDFYQIAPQLDKIDNLESFSKSINYVNKFGFNRVNNSFIRSCHEYYNNRLKSK